MSKLNQVPVQVGNSFDFNNLRLINVILMGEFSSFEFPSDLRIAIIMHNKSDNLSDYVWRSDDTFAASPPWRDRFEPPAPPL
jgi:hypothetical protein